MSNELITSLAILVMLLFAVFVYYHEVILQMDEDLTEVQATYRKLTSDLLLSGVDPLLLAGVMTASGLRLYKNHMVREEFLQMLEIVYEEALKDD